MISSHSSNNPGSPWVRVITSLWWVVYASLLIFIVAGTVKVLHQPPSVHLALEGAIADDPHDILMLQAAALLGLLAFGCFVYQLYYTIRRRRIEPVVAIDISAIPASLASLTNEPQEYAAAAAAGLVQHPQNQQVNADLSHGKTEVRSASWSPSDIYKVDAEFISRSVGAAPCTSDAIQQISLDPRTSVKMATELYGKLCRWLHRPDIKGWPFLFCVVCSVGSVVMSAQVIELQTWRLVQQYDVILFSGLVLMALLGITDDISCSKTNLFRTLFIVGMAICILLGFSDSVAIAVQALPVVLCFLCLASATLVPQTNGTVLQLKSQLIAYQMKLNSMSHEQKMECLEGHPHEQAIAVVCGVCPAEMAISRQFRELTHKIKHPGKDNRVAQAGSV